MSKPVAAMDRSGKDRGDKRYLSAARVVASSRTGPRVVLNQSRYGTHSPRRTKATLIYDRTENIRAISSCSGIRSWKARSRYLGIEVDDALEISEQTEI